MSVFSWKLGKSIMNLHSIEQEGSRAQPFKEWQRCWGHGINWLAPTRSKMVDKSTSIRTWATVYAHCNTSSGKWHTRRHHGSSKGDHEGQGVGIGPNSRQSLPLPKISGMLLSLITLWIYPPYKGLAPLPPGTSCHLRWPTLCLWGVYLPE